MRFFVMNRVWLLAARSALALAVFGVTLSGWESISALAGSEDYKYEYKTGDCHYKYKENKHGYKEEYKCHGKPYDRPKYKYESKTHDCKYKYEESSSGYKEEYKCHKGHDARFAGGGYWPKHMKRGPQVTTGAPFGIDLGNCNRELLGQVLGGALGGLTGSQIGDGTGQVAAVAGGTFLGLLIGGEIGRAMDEIDQRCAGQVLEHAPDNRPIVWQNPDNGAQHQMTPSGSFSDSQGRYCREYQSSSVVGGKTQQTYGTACRQPDDSWKITK